MSYQPPYLDYSNQLALYRQELLPRRGNRVLPAICCPKCLHEGQTVPLMPTVCFGVTTPSNNGKYYWQCSEPCAWFRFLPSSNRDLDRDVVQVNPALAPPGPPHHGPPHHGPPPPGPPPSYPGYSGDSIVVPMFPSSSPIASPTRPRNSPTSTLVNQSIAPTQAPASTSASTSTASGKLTCSGCGKAANKLCQRRSCKTCCEKQGGCEITAHRRGRMLALAHSSQSVARSTPTARGGVLYDLIMGPIDYPDDIDIPTSTPQAPAPTPSTASSTAPSQAPATLPTPTLSSGANTASSSQRNQSFAQSLNPTWTRFLDSGKDTREKQRWMEDAREKQLIVDQITVTVVVWFEAGVEPIQAERSIPRRLSKEWRFGEDAFLCDAAGIKTDTRTIQKYCQNPDGRRWWHAFEITHPHSLLPGGFYFFAVTGLTSSAMPSFAELVNLAVVPNQNILGRNRNSAARAAPSSFGALLPGQGKTLSVPPADANPSSSSTSSVTSVRIDPKLLQERMASTRSRPLPRHQVEVVIPLRQKRPSTEVTHPSKRHQPLPTTVQPSTSEGTNSEQVSDGDQDTLPSARRWPQEFSVHEINNGFLAMQSKSGTNPQKFLDVFGVPFVKTTFTKYRALWYATEEEERDRCLALPDGSQEALFGSIFRR